MLKIGDFSRLSKVSVRMLRYYDEMNIIKPSKVDKFTGYRYYNEEQLLTMGKINSLKDMGFNVTAIGEMIKADDSPQKMKRMFESQKAQLMRELEILNKQIQLLDIAIERLRKDKIMSYDCIVKQIPNRYVASVRQIIPRYDEEWKLWHILFSETAKIRMIPCGSAMAILHDKEYKEKDVDVEVQIEVKGKFADTENVKFKKESEQLVASTIFKGSYSQFPDVYASLAKWVSDNGYEFAGAMMDIYHVSPNETQNPDEFVTEICCPIQKK